jgi:hypothetical protein
MSNKHVKVYEQMLQFVEVYTMLPDHHLEELLFNNGREYYELYTVLGYDVDDSIVLYGGEDGSEIINPTSEVVTETLSEIYDEVLEVIDIYGEVANKPSDIEQEGIKND